MNKIPHPEQNQGNIPEENFLPAEHTDLREKDSPEHTYVRELPASNTSATPKSLDPTSGNENDDRVQPVLWPTLLSIGFSQLMVAIPVLWMLIDAVEHPKPLAFYIAALLLPPAGIAWTVLLFSKLRLYPAWGIYFASFFLLSFLLGVVLGIPWGISQEVFLLSTFSIGAGYYSGNVLVVYLEVLKLSRMSSVEYAAYVQQQKAEQENNIAYEETSGATFMVFAIFAILIITIAFSANLPSIFIDKKYNYTIFITQATIVMVICVCLSVIFNRILKIKKSLKIIIILSLLCITISLGVPYFVAIIPGLSGYILGNFWMEAVKVSYLGSRERIRQMIYKYN